MVGVNEKQFESLERRSATLFLVAGLLLAVFAALLGVEAFTNTSAPEDVFGPPGFLVAMVGLLGLYSRLADRGSRLARASAVVAAVAAVGWSVITVAAVAEVAGILPAPEDVGVLGIAIIMVAGITMVLAYVSFGVASLRSDAHSRTLGLLLLTPPTIFGVMAAGGAIGYTPAWSAFVLGSGQALAHLAIGFTLRSHTEPTDREELEPPIEPTA